MVIAQCICFHRTSDHKARRAASFPWFRGRSFFVFPSCGVPCPWMPSAAFVGARNGRPAVTVTGLAASRPASPRRLHVVEPPQAVLAGTAYLPTCLLCLATSATHPRSSRRRLAWPSLGVSSEWCARERRQQEAKRHERGPNRWLHPFSP